jgi:hypothetical protein
MVLGRDAGQTAGPRHGARLPDPKSSGLGLSGGAFSMDAFYEIPQRRLQIPGVGAIAPSRGSGSHPPQYAAFLKPSSPKIQP